jgi:hypothetical protein
VVNGNDPGAESAAELFDLLWGTLADVLGTAATATLLRRAIKQSAARTAWSEPAVVARDDGLDYTYRLPEAWKQPGNDEAVDVFRIIAAELKRLLIELTGPVVVARLGHLAPLRKWGIDFSDEARNA